MADTGSARLVRTIHSALLLRRAPLDVLLGVVELLAGLRFFLSEVRAAEDTDRWRCSLCDRPGRQHAEDGMARNCPVHRGGELLGAIEAATAGAIDLSSMSTEELAGHTRTIEEVSGAWRRLALARGAILGARLVAYGAPLPLEEAKAACETLRARGIDPITGEPLAGPADASAAPGGAR